MKLALVLPVVMLVAAGAGAGQGLMLKRIAPGVAPQPDGAAAHGADAHGKVAPPSNVRELKPIITNLAAPAGAWVRLEAALIYENPPDPKDEAKVAEVAQDTLGYLRTLTAAQLEGAAGLKHLREDLNERVALRTDGKVREVAIETMVIQ
jgi:flagellar protein FliL